MGKSSFNLENSIKGIFRLAFTSQVVLDTGLKWLLGKRPPTPKLLRETFERLGTTYIKLGQFIASSPSFFPQPYVEEFQNCLDNTPPVPFPTILKVIREDLKKPLSLIYSEIDPKPLASASIAQVHAAKLLDGQEVVIKVQKPGVQNILLTDLNFLYIAAKILEKIAPHLSLVSLSEIVEEIQHSMLAECNFFQEASNIDDFNQFLLKTNNTNVIAPKVHHHASSLRVLTMDRLYGVPFTDLERIKKYASDPQNSLIIAMNTWFSSLLLGKSFHADVHAGNLLILKDGRIAFIDFGIVGRIKPATWQSVTQFIQAITQNDYLAMAKAMVGIGITKGSVDVQAFAKDIQKLYENTEQCYQQSQSTFLQEQDINHVILELVNIAKRYGIHFPREFALLLKQILYFDRYVQLLAPDMNIYLDKRLNLIPELV